jgi:hypothetical protein
VSPELVGVLIGSGIGIIIVIIQSLVTLEINRAERNYNFRKQVYLETAEGIKNGYDSFTNLMRLDIDDNKLGDIFKEPRGWSFRLHIIASLETIKSLNEAFNTLVSSTIALWGLRMEVRKRLNRIGSLQHELAQISELFELTKRMAPSLPEPTPYEKQIIVPLVIDVIKTKKDRLTVIYSELENLQNEANHFQLQLSRAALKAQRDYSRKVNDVIIGIRKELKHNIKEKEFRLLMDDNSINVDDLLDNLINEFTEK